MIQSFVITVGVIVTLLMLLAFLLVGYWYVDVFMLAGGGAIGYYGAKWATRP